MCVGICLLQLNGVSEFCGFVLLKLCYDGRVKLFIVVPLINFGHGEMNEMFF
jgi:hypothetical protein